MVEFISVFLGLVTGLQPVAVRVTGEIARVELRLDGRQIGVLAGAPWEMVCDLGDDLSPHELMAIGRDTVGREVDRDLLVLNLPRPRSEISLVLEQNQSGTQYAGVRWHSLDRQQPDAALIRLDGEPLEVSDPRRIELPPLDPAASHLLTAELLFGEVWARAHTVIGGSLGDEASTELTGVPVLVNHREKLPPLEQLAGWFSAGSRLLEVVAVERGAADIVIVHAPCQSLDDSLQKLQYKLEYLKTRRTPGGMSAAVMVPTGLAIRDRLRVLAPVAEEAGQATQPAMQFPLTADIARLPGGITNVVTHPLVRPGSVPAQRVRLADAVAVAGVVAAAASRTRAVVLITDSECPDASHYDAATVRRYLQQLQVPLVVWTARRKADGGAWGGCRDISSAERLLDAVEHLRSLLDRQAVVWVRGRHLPQHITVSPSARTVLRLAGEEPRVPDQTGSRAGTVGPLPTVVAAPAYDQPLPDLGVAPLTFSGSQEVRVVTVEVVATGDGGTRVVDLGKQDFEVLEDGTPVEISHFVAPASSVAASGPSKEAVEGAEKSMGDDAVFGREEDQRPLTLVIVLDLAHLQPGKRTLMIRPLQRLLRQGLPRPAEVMLATNEGSLRIRQKLTEDLELVAASLDELAASLSGYRSSRQDRLDLHRKIISAANRVANAADSGDPVREANAAADCDSVMSELHFAAQVMHADIQQALEILQQLTISLGGITGRKVLLWVGDELMLEPAADLYAAVAQTLPMDGSTQSEQRALSLRDQGEELVRLANANGVTCYTLTPPTSSELHGAEMAQLPPPNALSYFTLMRSTYEAAVREGACRLSGGTGGSCQVGGSDPSILLAAAAQDLTATYQLAWTPRHPSDGQYHRIEVRTRREGVELRHREGYLDRSDDDRLFDRLAAALYFGQQDNPLQLTVAAGPSRPLAEGRWLVPLRVTVDVAFLAALPGTSGGGRRCQAKLLVSSRDAAGRSFAPQSYPISFALDTAKLTPGTATLYAHDVHLTLTSGEHTVAIGLWDLIGRTGSFLTTSVRAGQ